MVAPSAVAYTMATTAACRNKRYQNLGWLDIIASVLFLSSLWVETMADNQQQAFQAKKHRYVQELKGALVVAESDQRCLQEYQDGFCQSGLFAIVRKPNYAAEQVLWWSFVLFSVAAGAPMRSNWSFIGAISLSSLFQVSGGMTERISQRKYPRYQRYMRRVPRCVPNVWSSSFWNRQNRKVD
jgi:steroid 5-alpha reductase family enzyme